MRRILCVWLLLAVVLVACGDDDAVPLGSSSVAPTEATPLGVAEAIVGSMGPDEGFAAVLYALDSGYTTTQVSAAALSGVLGPDGSIPGVAPDGSAFGLIIDPGGGDASVSVTVVLAAGVGGEVGFVAEGPGLSPEEVYRELDTKMATLASIQLLGLPLGVGADIGYQDVFPSAAAPGGPGPVASPEGAKVMIGVLISLVDVGYTFDQALSGYIFGEWTMAIGLDMTGESSTGLELDGRPVSSCFVLRDDAGGVVQPEGTASGVFYGSATCANAIRQTTISFDGLERLKDFTETTTTTSPTATPTSTGGGYTFEASLELIGERSSLTGLWSGSFTVDEDDGTISGSGSGESTSEGECSINEGAPHPYSFTTTWTFAISGTSDGEQIEPIVTPNPGSVSTSENPETESGATCVGFARDFAPMLAEVSLGEQAPADIVVPVGGGTTRIDQGPTFIVDIEIRPVADDH